MGEIKKTQVDCWKKLWNLARELIPTQIQRTQPCHLVNQLNQVRIEQLTGNPIGLLRTYYCLEISEYCLQGSCC
jgi:hypothetical protein